MEIVGRTSRDAIVSFPNGSARRLRGPIVQAVYWLCKVKPEVVSQIKTADRLAWIIWQIRADVRDFRGALVPVRRGFDYRSARR